MYTRCIIELAFVRDTATIPLGGGHGQNSVRDQQLERLYPLIFLPPTLCSLSDISGASPNSILVINGFPTPPLFLRLLSQSYAAVSVAFKTVYLFLALFPPP